MRNTTQGQRAGSWVALLAALFLLLAACGGTGGDPAAAPTDDSGGEAGHETATDPASGGAIPLGGVIDQTAYLADFDGAVRQGVDLAIESINNDGGVLDGRPLEISFIDMEADPAQGVRAIQRLVTDGSVALLHGFTSASTSAGQQMLADNEVPMIAASVLPEDEAFVFSTIPPARFETGIRADYLLEQGIADVGVLSDGTPYNELQLEVLQGVDGINIVGAEQHTPDAVDLRSQITALLQAGAEAIVKFSAGPTNIVAAQAMSQVGTDAPLLTGIDNLQVLGEAAGLYDNFLTVASAPQAFDVLPEDQRSDALVSFRELYENAGMQDDPTYIGRGWDAVFLVAEAIEESGNAESADIAAALESMAPYEGASGTFEFTEESHYGFNVNPYYIVEFADDGSLEIIYTPDGS